MGSSTKRLRHILAANLHAVLDRAEDPEKMLRAILHELEEARSEARRAIEHLERARRNLAVELREAQRGAERWQGRAEKALAAGDEAAARDAVERRHDALKAVSELQGQADDAGRAVERLGEDLQKLEEKGREIRERCRRVSSDRAERRFAQRYASPADACLARSQERWDRIQSRLERIEARIEAYELVEQGSPDPETRAAVEAELAALKARME